MARNIGSQYTLHRVLGRGAAGTVWLADGPHGPVAVKVMREDLAADPELVERFAHERHTLLGLEHPNIVGVRDLITVSDPVRREPVGAGGGAGADTTGGAPAPDADTTTGDTPGTGGPARDTDAGTESGTDGAPTGIPRPRTGPRTGPGPDLALVMDLVRGPDLRAHLREHGPLAPAGAVGIVADIAAGLAVAHAAGIVHRDVKPENILLDTTGERPVALLTDFGVAQLVDEPRRGSGAGVVGTPDYMAPEIIEGLPSRAPVDIYALATVLYELLAGFTPFGGGHSGAVLRRQVTEQAAPLPGLPEELWHLIQQCLAKSPASRLRASELAARLREIHPALRGLPALEVEAGPAAGGVPAARNGRAPHAGAARPGTVNGRGASSSAVGAPTPTPDPAGRTTGRSGGPAAATGRPGAPAGSPDHAGYAGPHDIPGEDGDDEAPAARRGAVPLVDGSDPDDERVTHTRMRVPDAGELTGGPRGTARVPRDPRSPRAGSARHGAAERRRRLALTLVVVLLPLLLLAVILLTG